MEATRDGLIKLGIEVDVSLDAEPSLSGYDLVHVFNVQDADRPLRQLHNAGRRNVPAVVSTIYWDMRHIMDRNESFKYSPGLITQLLYRIHPAASRLYYNVRSYPTRKHIFRCIRQILREADLLLPNSYAELDILAEVFRLPDVRGKAAVVPSGVDPDEWLNDDGPITDMPDLPSEYILQVASYAYMKGQAQLIRALMDRPEVPLVFVGYGPDSPYALACRTLGDQRGNTYFFAYMAHDRLRWMYRRARVHVLPSLRESPGLTTLEAAVNGANCVVSVHGPVGEYFGDDAWVCDPGDIGSVREAVLGAWAAPRDGRLRERVLANHTWDKAAEMTLQAYGRVLKAKSR